MEDCLHFDYETASPLNLPEVGLDRYVTCPETLIILCAYQYGDSPILQWEPQESPIPTDLEDKLSDERVIKWGWNCSFERNATQYILGIDSPIRSYKDSMALARYVSLPGSLSECGKALNLPVHLLKIEGDQLKDMFCLPAKPGGQETLFGLSSAIFRTKESNPDEWERFKAYNKQDVVAEMAIKEKLVHFPLPDNEWELFFLDQEINDRGVMTDKPLVEGGSFIAEIDKKYELDRLQSITGLNNPNSTEQLLGWIRDRGYPFHSVGKPFVMRALAGEGSLTSECKEALIIRQKASKTSSSKLINIHNQLSADGRLRHQYNYYGASRTGRWTSGSGE